MWEVLQMTDSFSIKSQTRSALRSVNTFNNTKALYWKPSLVWFDCHAKFGDFQTMWFYREVSAICFSLLDPAHSV